MTPSRFFIALSLGFTALAAGAAQPQGGGYALIVGVARFADPAISTLPGLQNDVAIARRISSYIGIPNGGTTVLADAAATADAVRSQLGRIAQAVGENEKVFVYFSTHGSRWLNEATGACDESLVFYDGQHITKEELAAMLKPVAQKAYKLLLFIDSCHSGGFTVTRSVDSKLVPKFHRDEKTDSRCEAVINDLADKLSPVPPHSRGISPNSVVVITAARQNEYALHREDIGGLATNAWAQCAFGKATDRDGSGAITFDEVEACAQEDIEDQLRGVREYKAHHIMTQGVRSLPLSLLTAAAETSVPPPLPITPAPPVVVKPVQQQPVQQQQTAPVPVQEVVKRPVGPAATLQDIVAMSDGRWGLDVSVPSPTLQIQKDFLALRLRSDRAGFVYLLAVGSDNKTVDILFPNRLDKRNTVRAGEEMTLPRMTWRLRAQGPPGTNRLLVVVAETERDILKNSFEDLAGVFLRAPPNQSSTLQRGFYTASTDGKCKAINERGAVVDAPCTPRFAARVVEVQEVVSP